MMLIAFIASSQPIDFSEADNHAASLIPDPSVPLREMSLKLTEPFDSDLLKTRSVFRWLAGHITYEKRGTVTNGPTRYPSDRDILLHTYHTGKGDCRGFALLFKQLLDQSGIRSRVIYGYARNGPENCCPKNPNHAWNSVQIDGRWTLFDVTWAAASPKGVNDFWFMTDPDLFILNHYPVIRSRTYTEKTCSPEEFLKFPIYTEAYFDLQFTEKPSLEGFFRAEKDTVTIPLLPEIECLLLTSLYNMETGEWIPTRPGALRTGQGQFSLFIPVKGRFLLKVGALVQEEASYRVYEELIYYTVENR